jgi:hypothetical protein
MEQGIQGEWASEGLPGEGRPEDRPTYSPSSDLTLRTIKQGGRTDAHGAKGLFSIEWEEKASLRNAH